MDTEEEKWKSNIDKEILRLACLILLPHHNRIYDKNNGGKEKQTFGSLYFDLELNIDWESVVENWGSKSSPKLY